MSIERLARKSEFAIGKHDRRSRREIASGNQEALWEIANVPGGSRLVRDRDERSERTEIGLYDVHPSARLKQLPQAPPVVY
jgi:hypothetical protein